MSEKGFSIKGQMVNILDFVGRMVSVVTLSLILFSSCIPLGLAGWVGKHNGPALLPVSPGVKEGGRLEARAWGWAQNSCGPPPPQVSDSSRKSWAQEQLLVANLLSPPAVFFPGFHFFPVKRDSTATLPRQSHGQGSLFCRRWC